MDNDLSDSIASCDTVEDEDLIVGLKAGLQKLRHYYDIMSPIAVCAVLLSPNLGKKALQKLWEPFVECEEWMESALASLNTFFEAYNDSANIEQDSVANRKRKADQVDLDLDALLNGLDTEPVNQLTAFLGGTFIMNNPFDVLDWWNGHKATFPILARMMQVRR